MAGPHSPNHGLGPHGPVPHGGPGPGDGPTLDYPEPAYAPLPVPLPANAGGPAAPKRGHQRLIIGAAGALALIAILTAAILYGVRTNGARAGGALTDASAKTAIQSYLDALEHHDVDAIVRNALCGMYDGVHDKRTDQKWAAASSEDFRNQFARAQVTSIDAIVYLSQYQAQVLFTMQTSPASGGHPQDPIQARAQLLGQHGQILVCSYGPRTGASSH